MKKLFSLLMAFVVTASLFAIPQKSLSAKDAKAGFEKAPVTKALKATMQKNNKQKCFCCVKRGDKSTCN